MRAGHKTNSWLHVHTPLINTCALIIILLKRGVKLDNSIFYNRYHMDPALFDYYDR